MRILIVNQHVTDVVGGSETQCHRIASQLTAMGHDVIYGVSHPRKRVYDVPYSVRLITQPFVKTFREALREVQPDVVYWRFNKKYLLRSVLEARRAGVKFVFAISHINDMRAFVAKPFHAGQEPLLKILQRSSRFAADVAFSAINSLAINWADGIVFQHTGQIPRKFGQQHVVIYNSAPRIDSYPSNDAPSYVLWVANVKRSKNPETVIRLARDLLDTAVEFRMVGEIQEANYHRLLNPAALPPNLRYMGYQNQDSVHALITGALFIVHTCDEEGFPNIFIQSWLQSKAVVSLHFDPGGTLKNHRIGFCSGSYEAFRRDVSLLISDEVIRGGMGARGLQFALENCNPEKNVQALESFLETVISS